MRVLIDTNIAFTYVTGRMDPYSEEIRTILYLCSEDKLTGILAFHSLSTIWYLTRKAPEQIRREFIRRLCELLIISGADNNSIMKAIDNVDFRDFEDALQDCCAIASEADYIVTANIQDFRNHSTIPAVTPDELLSIL